MRAGSEGNKELGSVGIRAFVRHAEEPRGVERAGEVFVGESRPVDGFAACAIVAREIAALDHEAWDGTVDGGVFVVEGGLGEGGEAAFACAERPEAGMD